VVNWSRFDPNAHEITFNDRKLAVHDITRWDVRLISMSSRKRKYSDDEIETQILERVNDPDEWEAPVYVPPLAVERPSWVTLGRHLELAAKFHVVSILTGWGPTPI